MYLGANDMAPSPGVTAHGNPLTSPALSTTSPCPVCTSAITASSRATIMSQPHRKAWPNPMASPLRRAMTGFCMKAITWSALSPTPTRPPRRRSGLSRPRFPASS